jgi:serine/threonine protein kinase
MIVGETPFYSDSLIKTYQKIQNHEAELSFPDDVEISEDAQSIIRRLLTENSTRIGRDGADEIKAHPFFASPHWTFDNIQNSSFFYYSEVLH